MPFDVGLPSKRFLVVDDDRSSGSALVSLLEMAGHRAVSCQDGWTALDIVQTLDPEVAVLDLRLPGLDGFEVAKRLRSRGRNDLVLIALSGLDRPSDRMRSREAGFALHLAKPLDIDALASFLQSGGAAGDARRWLSTGRSSLEATVASREANLPERTRPWRLTRHDPRQRSPANSSSRS